MKTLETIKVEISTYPVVKMCSLDSYILYILIFFLTHFQFGTFGLIHVLFVFSGYHDSGAYPVPAFYNPMPWQPIHIPRPASEKKRKPRGKPKPKYAWNPEKYR